MSRRNIFGEIMEGFDALAQQRAGRRVADLEGAALAEWVARAQGWRIEHEGGSPICYDEQGSVYSFGKCGFRPDLNWSHGGPLIHCKRINIVDRAAYDGKFLPGDSMQFAAFIGDPYQIVDEGGLWFCDCQHGMTPLIAAMRAYVASVYGETVPEAP